MDTGPARERYDHDLVLTELLDGGHRFLVEAGARAAPRDRRRTGGAEATEEDQRAQVAQAEERSLPYGRSLDTRDIRDLLVDNLEHPRWDEVAERCLTCGN